MNNVLSYFVFLILTTAQLITSFPIEDTLIDTIFLRLYGDSVRNYLDSTVDSAALLLEKMDTNKSTVVYIHGYFESAESSSTHTIANAYLQRGDHNILAVDYRIIAALPYPTAAIRISAIGSALASAFNKMVKAGLDSEKLHIVGHSLGAQVSSRIGSSTSFELPRITGLDPAGPFFYLIMDPLSAKHARFVDIIHTDAGSLGIAETTGTVDFFPNGGHRIQPGCPIQFFFFDGDVFCSHHRSWRFYAESVIDPDAFVGVQCSSQLSFIKGDCTNNKQAIMGYATPFSTKGTYYLVTGSSSPYGLREDGIKYNGLL